MSGLADQSVHLIVTSPPYWQLKDYGSDEQIGFNDTYEEYINNLNIVWKECYRVLHDGCRLCINIGDQFARSVYYGRYKVIPIHSEIIRFCETIGLDFIKERLNTTQRPCRGGYQPPARYNATFLYSVRRIRTTLIGNTIHPARWKSERGGRLVCIE